MSAECPTMKVRLFEARNQHTPACPTQGNSTKIMIIKYYEKQMSRLSAIMFPFLKPSWAQKNSKHTQTEISLWVLFSPSWKVFWQLSMGCKWPSKILLHWQQDTNTLCWKQRYQASQGSAGKPGLGNGISGVINCWHAPEFCQWSRDRDS